MCWLAKMGIRRCLQGNVYDTNGMRRVLRRVVHKFRDEDSDGAQGTKGMTYEI